MKDLSYLLDNEFYSYFFSAFIDKGVNKRLEYLI